MTRIIAALLCLLVATPALAQSSPNLSYGQVPTAAQWNSYFAAKQDVFAYTPLNKAGDSMLGKLSTLASSSASAGFGLTPGAVPSSPLNGDLWTTSSGLFAQINGVTGQVAFVNSPQPFIGAQTIIVSGIGATSTDGLVVENTTAAAAGAQQWSPRLHMVGQGWKTAATAASQTVEWIAEVQAVQGSSAPTGNLVFSAQVNGGGYAARAVHTSGGFVGLGTESNPQYGFVFSKNAAAGLTFGGALATTGVLAEVDATIARLVVASWGANTAGFDGFSVGGTAASPSATPAGMQLNGLGGRGYANGAYTTAGSPVVISEMSLNSWTASDTSTYITFNTTPSASTTRAEAMRVNASGGLGVGTTTDPGIGAVLANTTVQAASAGAAATPSMIVGNSTTGLYSVSTTGLGISINAVSKMDFGVTTASIWTASAAFTSTGILRTSSAGLSSAPSLVVGNATTGLYSVSTTGIGVAVNGVLELDWGITTASTWTMVGNFNAPGLASLSANTTAYVCWTTSTGAVSRDSVTCLSSLRKLKKDIRPLDGATAELMDLKPRTFSWRDPMDQNQMGQQVGFVAEEVDDVDPRLASRSGDASLHGWRGEAMIALLTRGFQELKAENDNLRAELKKIRHRQ